MVDNNNSLDPYLQGMPTELTGRLLDSAAKTDRVQTIARVLNFWPKCTVLNRWYSAADWQNYADATYFHEQSFGDAAIPVPPAAHLNGIIIPFDAMVTNIDIWGIQSHDNAVTELAIYKFPLVEGAAGAGVGTQVGESIVFGATAKDKLVNLSQTFSPSSGTRLVAGDLLMPFARESVQAVSTPKFFGTLTFRQL